MLKLILSHKTLILLILLLVALTAISILTKTNLKLKNDYDRQTRNVAILTSSPRIDTIRDTVIITTQGVINANVQELRHQNLIDADLIRDLKIKIKDIDNSTTISKSVSDTVILIKHDSTYHYADFWAKIDIDLNSSECIYQVRDSISTIMYKKYKHKFLWWRWGNAGYEVKIINFNPHSKIKYNQTIKISK